MLRYSALAIAAIVPFALTSPAQAAQIKMMASGAMSHALQDIGNEFAKKNGHTIEYTVSTTGVLQDKLRGGEKADIIEVTSAGMDQLEKEKLVDPSSRVEVARALVGVAVRDGARAPDISTPEALKAALVAAPKVAYIDPKIGGQAGQTIVSLLQKLGINDEVAKKSVYGKTGAEAVQKMVAGDGDIVISFTSEILPIKGAKLVGPLPAALQNPSSYAAAIPVGAPNPELSRALLREMTGAEGKKMIVEAGLEPIAK
jgi:molybdate transport system substrate-binding protein